MVIKVQGAHKIDQSEEIDTFDRSDRIEKNDAIEEREESCDFSWAKGSDIRGKVLLRSEGVV